MKCAVCRHGETRDECVTVTLERGAAAVVFRQVPALVCGNCGEVYHTADVTAALMRQAEQIIAAGAELDVRRFAQAA